MTKFITEMGISKNPFENYAAETEPNISEYAVRPPYLMTISDRAFGLSSFVLFGARGSGKSATRITVFNEIWSGSAGESWPLAVNLTDFSAILAKLSKKNLSDIDLVRIAGFFIVEKVLLWLISLEESDRNIFIEGLDDDELTLVYAIFESFYTSVAEADREVSDSEALRLLNAAWTTKSAAWISKRWTPISRLAAVVLSTFSKNRQLTDGDTSEQIEKILLSLQGDGPKVARSSLEKLVQFVRFFGFSGICLLVDKVDETNLTSNSAEASAMLVHPILDHIQLLEVEGLSWIFFLWDSVQRYFESSLPVRLDKISHANITWEVAGLREMVEARVNYFSAGSKSVADLFDSSLDVDATFGDLVAVSVRSPRELIRLFDTIIREHDASGSKGALTRVDVDLGTDKYVSETTGGWYKERYFQQVLRLGRPAFVNKDVASKFRISAQGAGAKIKTW